MADQILMTPEEMRSNATTIDNYRDNIVTILGQLDTTIRLVEEGWKGASQCSFLDGYRDLKANALSKFPDILEGISSQLNASANTMEQTDQELANMLRGN